MYEVRWLIDLDEKKKLFCCSSDIEPGDRIFQNGTKTIRLWQTLFARFTTRYEPHDMVTNRINEFGTTWKDSDCFMMKAYWWKIVGEIKESKTSLYTEGTEYESVHLGDMLNECPFWIKRGEQLAEKILI